MSTDRPTVMSRWRAASIHLAISATIGAIVAAMLFFVWYPPPYFKAAGADVLVLLLVGVDVALGPFLTLVVFRSGKRGLKFDLACIGLAQAMALVYGMSIVLKTRPVFLCGYVDIFAIVSAYEIDPKDLALGSKPEFRSLSWTGARLVGAKMPEGTEAHNKMVVAGFAGKDLDTFPGNYVDYADVAADLLAKAKPLAELRTKDATYPATIDRWLQRYARKDADVVWLPLHAPRDQLVMLLDAKTGQPVGPVPVNPYTAN